jgi:DNA replication protein DnaC
MSDLQRQQGTSGAAQPTKEQKPKLFYNNPQDLVKIVEGNGFNREVAGGDFVPLCNAASRAFGITTPRRVGLIVTGDYGCGKTFFVKCLRIPNAHFIDLTLAETVEWLDQHGGYQTSLDEMCNRNIILDDLGAESIKNEYGVKRDIVGEFICRYHTKGKGRLFITTNLRGPELLDRYGGRVVDRLKQLCVPFHMNGKSKRKWL